MFCVSVTLASILQQLCQHVVEVERQSDQTAEDDVSECFIVIIHVESDNSKSIIGCLAQLLLVLSLHFVESV